MTTSAEQTIHIESVKIPQVRDRLGVLTDLGASIRDEGLRHPITVWTDGTLVSGARRLRSHFLLAGATGGDRFRRIPAVFIDTVEAAAKQLLADSQDEYLALPMTGSDACRLWEVLRRLDAPAAVQRTQRARRRGAELRRQTRAGKRQPGRSSDRTDDHVLSVLCESFGLSETTASRLWGVYTVATSDSVSPERRQQGRLALKNVDEGHSTIWANYKWLIQGRTPPPSRPRTAAPTDPIPAVRQRAAWDRSLPQMEGLVAGLIELGPPNADLTWDQVGPVHARLKAVRRDLEKIINKMKEISQS